MKEQPKFNTITGDDWRKNLAASRKRRADAPERQRTAVEDARRKTKPKSSP